MTTTLNASNSGSGGLVATADASGVLALQTAGVTAVTIDTSQRTAFVAGTAALPAITTTDDTNTGIFFPAADTIAFSEGGAEAMRIDSSSNLQFNSGYGSVATAYGCRAWVSFTGSTAAIRGSANVSSITRNGTGNYVVNYSTAMPDTNYSAVASCSGQGSTNGSTNCILVNASAGGTNVAPTTTATTLFCYHPGNQTSQDTAYINFAVFR